MQSNNLLKVQISDLKHFEIVLNTFAKVQNVANIKFVKIDNVSTKRHHMIITTFDRSQGILVIAKIWDIFSIFDCDGDKISFNININELREKLALVRSKGSLRDYDMLTLTIFSNDRNFLNIKNDGYMTVNTNKITYNILIVDTLMNMSFNPMSDAIITINSNELSNIYDKFQNVKNIVLNCFSDKLVFYDHDCCYNQIVCEAANNSNNSKNNNDSDSNIVNYNVYIIRSKELGKLGTKRNATIELDKLRIFGECHQLCHSVKIYMGQSTPLCLKYDIAQIGHIIIRIDQVSNC